MPLRQLDAAQRRLEQRQPVVAPEHPPIEEEGRHAERAPRVRLANHEILMVRQGAWALARAAKERFRVAPIALAHLCDARWEDSRAFAFEFVRSFPADVLAPDIVIAICDSIDPAVQRFGQTLLTEHWREEHAARYLLRLSEHPATNIQLLVSGLLDRYARGNLELLQRLLRAPSR